MLAFYTDCFVLPLPPRHRFPMEKYARLRRVLADRSDGPSLRIPPAATDRQLLRVHTPDYLRRVVQGALAADEVRAIGFPWSPALVERSRRSTGATLAACAAACRDGVAVNLAGGTHHAFAGQGAGFCVFNDAAVAARDLQAVGLAERVLILDADVHQGDGTAAIFAGDASVFTFSIHGAENYPFRKMSGDLDIGLPTGTDDEGYLAALGGGLDAALAFGPDLVIYLAGADPYAGDRLGKLALTQAGLAARDRLVLEAFRSAGVPVAIAMAGGYCPEVERIVEIHAQTVLLAAEYQNVAG